MTSAYSILPDFWAWFKRFCGRFLLDQHLFVQPVGQAQRCEVVPAVTLQLRAAGGLLAAAVVKRSLRLRILHRLP